MKRFLISAALACVFSTTALAGDIPSDGFTSQTPGDVSSIVDGNIPGQETEVGYYGEMSEIALDFLHLMTSSVV